MGRGWLPKTLLLAGLAWLALILNLVAIPGEYNSHLEGLVDPRASIPTGLSRVYTLAKPEVYGWAAHPHAAVILIALAALFILNINLGPAWMRRRYWIALAALFACLLLPMPDQLSLLAVPAFTVALIAALLSRRAGAVSA